MKQGTNAGLSLLIVLYFNHRGTGNTENTDSRVLLGWKEATEATFGRDVDSIYSPRTGEPLCSLYPCGDGSRGDGPAHYPKIVPCCGLP